jgi:osmotically-inducible protein OsmY
MGTPPLLRTVLVLSVAAAGCAGQGTTRRPLGDAGQGVNGPDAPKRGFDPEGMPDSWIVRVLLRELGREGSVANERIDVRSDEGIVVLSGQLSTELAHERAVAIAHVVRGVRGIIDELEVGAPAPEDVYLEMAAAAALESDRVTARQPIAARAWHGAVALWGDVDSEATRRIAVANVLAASGVRRVDDYLVVAPHRARSDEPLADEADRAVHQDPWVDASGIVVTAERGVVRLHGTVRSPAELSRVEQDARTASPRAIDTTALQLVTAPDDGTRRARPWTARSDDAIARAVRDALTRDPRVGPQQPAVQVHAAVVLLTGAIGDAAAASAAHQDAEHVIGVEAVRDAVTRGEASGVPDDAGVRRAVAHSLGGDPRLATQVITVDASAGRVALRGVVESEWDRLHAITLAASVPGVSGVDDGLAVAEPHLGHSDAYIARAVRQEMDMSRWVMSREIAVSVRRGVVTLDGSVDDPGERAAATELASRAGARAVINRILIRSPQQP